MHKYVIKRLLMMIPVLLCVAFVIYAIMNVAEGDPVYSVVSADATEAQIEAAREELGLNGTLLERYFRYVKGMLTGDLGTSYVSKRDVMQTYLERLPNTLKLASVTNGRRTGHLHSARNHRSGQSEFHQRYDSDGASSAWPVHAEFLAGSAFDNAVLAQARVAAVRRL